MKNEHIAFVGALGHLLGVRRSAQIRGPHRTRCQRGPDGCNKPVVGRPQ